MVESGGVLFGYWDGDSLTITELSAIMNHSADKRRFRFPAALLTDHVHRRNFVGVFHTHQYFLVPSLRDCLTMRSLTRELDMTLVLGILTNRLSVWKFKPGKLLPRLVPINKIKRNDLDST